ncbi:MAG: hydroxymethylglutaryl-CoA reductase [Gammaproteobacteria bacterium]|nr:hydroxymethylglutaryl-CoA reductase [Gammaproteobacteria bacterium]
MYTEHALIPMRAVGPMAITGPVVEGSISLPLATYETPLWASANRGAKVSRLCGGIQVHILANNMTRSVLVEADHAGITFAAAQDIESQFEAIDAVIRTTSRFAQLQHIHCEPIGRQLFIRIAIHSADASGHNMATKAAESALQWILKRHSALRYVSLSGNFCADKKVSAVNGLLRRGKYTIAEATLSAEIVRKHLRSTPTLIAALNTKKNLLGSIAAGSLRSANAHVANTLLAAYLATGQDAANIVEGSQAITTAEVTENGDLYFALTLPNLIVGTVGNGKHLPFVKDNLKSLDCLEPKGRGENSERLAGIIAAACWCSELSLLAALTNPEELMRAHTLLERQEEARHAHN